MTTRHTRPRRAAVGYGKAHQLLRAQWAPLVALGIVDCSRCRQRIKPWDEWHLDHDDYDRTKYRGPSHQSCNVRAPALKSINPPPQPRTPW